VVLYAVGQIGTGLAQLVLWWTPIRRPGLLGPDGTPRRIRYVTVQLLRSPITFGLSIPVTLLVGPETGMASWAVLVALAVAVGILFRDVRGSRG
jgi:hypothetical protein